ncbi:MULTISPECIES: SGNH/GDSL hydrolase family protein [Mycobacterium]|uniref:Hydrolase n=1 Tax=Mycobacterium kiyosense TaxID=2871094 RepID=A0A9P3QCV0_9MYCO|nr:MULTISPECIES: SGNH/GDSL hydrolase family protein [Mycobacterium]BDB45695.1 hydrolase [Mycobacterium kiyosense]BDE11310.1 hydrolase [Mycobacterium sp. 20KCMC460]GLB84604.1 hydrolase [Mycobacterium kiyosense]GLB91271.1 hydrolase [Mycobacterium kiyosense]GLB97720.1 hydrolase [Mycobacterium kiyosense]
MVSTRLGIAMLVGCVCVGCAAAPPAGPGSASRPRYVAMGDSFAAAPGVPERAAPRNCHKSTNNYPAILARRLAATTFRDVTCSGATTDDIYSRAQQTGDGLVPRQLDALDATTELITITVGANDVGLAADAESCEVKGSNPRPCSEKLVVDQVDSVSRLISEQAPVWAAMLDEVRARAPHARIIVVGYGLFLRTDGCYPEQPILPADANYLQAKIDELDDRQRQLATQKGVEFFDTRAMSRDHDMCAPPAERYVEGYATRNRAVPLHPTALGAAAIGNALTDYLVLSENR